MQFSADTQAEFLIRDTGARLTRPRTRVLKFLLEQHEPMTHHEVHGRLPGDAIDTVTLYRVLEWLTENGIVHRIAGADQVWRFSANANANTNDRGGHQHHDHAHFQCTSCDSVTCFTDVPVPRRVKMPAGFTNEEVDFLIKGICPRCGAK
jgi:Fur family transcriptional regulator, ferric uptake regulator